MAAALVGGAFLSGFINVLFDRLASPEVANLIRGKKLDQKLLTRLETTLYAVQAVLNDAEQKQIRDPAVKKWLDDLKDAVYVADDLLDRVSTKAATQKEVSNLLSRYLNLEERKTVNKIADITSRLEDIVKYRDILGLQESAGQNLSWRTPSTSLEEGSNIHGRDQDKEAIIKLLLDDNSEGKISVIPIVGMGGVGKTTLAQFMYNDENLMKMFDMKAWVCVSEEFDIVKVTRTIIEAITSTTCNMVDLNLLQLGLKEKLIGKKFFIVLDDVWNENYVDWNILQTPFQYGTKGIKILVTTRSEKVASIVQSCIPYHLNQLSDEHCWLVFANHACFPESNGDSTLEKIGREIIKKCKGLPLAAQTLGGLLRAKHDVRDWNSILTSDLWELSVNDSKIIPALRISYYYLPPHLKRCFVYCSLYPKDYEFYKDELILLWMAEDLLARPERGKTLEEAGYECFDDLASRLFFNKCSARDGYFVMHDLMHDLAMSIAGEFYFRSEELGKESKMSMRTRHLSYGRLSHPISKNFDVIGRVKSLRTFLPINCSTPSFNIESAAFMILSKFKYLHILSFNSFEQLEVLPHSIGELIHLRFLDLSWTSISLLPKSLCNLYNLQTLKLRGCYKLTVLPSSMQNLVNLRHLDIDGTNLKQMPRGMSKLKNLQYLSDFVVGKHEENRIKELGKLSNIHGPLQIEKLENVTDACEALEARLMDKKHIDYLRLEWSSDGDMVTTLQTERDIFDKLQPHKGLKRLRVGHYRGTTFPDWVGHSFFHNMTGVSLYSCKNCCRLPSLGQLPSLKSLTICEFNGLETIGAEFYKNGNDHSSSAAPFPSLEQLEFSGMSCWQAWHSAVSDAFPQLKELTITDCPRLTGDLPNHLPALKELSIEGCEQLVSSLPKAPTIHRLRIYGSNKVRLQELPRSLQDLSIEGSQLVESMFEAMTISPPASSSAMSFPQGCIPASIKRLEIENCRDLEFSMEQLQQLELLESLSISDSCVSFTSFSLESFPNLKSLWIEKCEKLESLSFSQSHDAVLSRLGIGGCPNFVSFPTEGLAAPSMTFISIYRCNKLKSLPSHMNTLLPKLAQLWIWDCPEIDSFPEGGLPSSLRQLEIRNCEKLLSDLSTMGVHEGLSHLAIYGPCESAKSFPKEVLLPQLPSLTTLSLREFSCLETLDCKELLHLTSLEVLKIRDCPKLKNMAGERLPASLIKLEIEESPLLEKRCQKKHGEIWPKISHIRGIRVHGRWIS